MHINFKNYDNLICDIKNNIHKLPNDIDMIIGIPRSGMIPAYMLGLLLKLPVFSINELLHGITKQDYSSRHLKSDQIKKILIVDDSLRSGKSLKKVQNDVKGFIDKYEVLYGAIYVTSDKKDLVDWYAEEVGTPRFFQWNYLNHPEVCNACYDIDGVLCKDPTESENDDGEKYINFLKTATPLFIPSYKIHALVTSRLEKYRKETEEWLKKNNVQYDNLYMLNLKSKEERIKNKAHGTFKSEIYNKLNNTNIFYESDHNQAAQISTLTKKPVFCVNTDTLFLEGHEVFNKIKNDHQNIADYSYKMSIPLFEYKKNKNKAYYKLFGIPILKIKKKEKEYYKIKKIYILGIPVWRKRFPLTNIRGSEN